MLVRKIVVFTTWSKQSCSAFRMAGDVLEDALGLLGDIVRNDLACLRIERDLAGAKKQGAGPDPLRIRPDRGRARH